MAKILEKSMDFTIIDMKTYEAEVKKDLSTEEEPFEGEVPLAKVEAKIEKAIRDNRDFGKKYAFDGYLHKDSKSLIAFLDRFGMAEFIFQVCAPEDRMKERFAKRNDMDDFPAD